MLNNKKQHKIGWLFQLQSCRDQKNLYTAEKHEVNEKYMKVHKKTTSAKFILCNSLT